MGKLTPEEREQLNFGVRRKSEDGDEIVVSSTYSRVSNLVDLHDDRNHKFFDIATLSIAELIDIART